VSGTFTLWEELKAYAKSYADSDRPLPVDGQCEQWLRALLDRHIDARYAAGEAFDFYSAELHAMVEDYRSR